MTVSKSASPKAKIDADHPLFDVVEEAYKVFACAPPASAMVTCCQFCLPPEQERQLLGANQRDIPYHLMRDWYFASVAPDVPKSLWCFLFPRILEILAVGEDLAGLSGIEVTFSSRFQVGDRIRWSDVEWQVIEAFRTTFLNNFPLNNGLDANFEDAMVMFVLAGWDAHVLFDQLWNWKTEDLVVRLEDHWSIRRHDGTIRQRPWISSWWPDEELARSFFLSSRMYDRLVAFGTDANTPEPLGEKALGLADCIYWELGGVEGLKAGC